MLLFRNFSTFKDLNFRLLVKGLPFDVTESDIKQLFTGFNLSSIHFITRRNKPLGSCYVYLEENEAKDAIKLLNGKFFKQKKLEVTLDLLKIDDRIQLVHKPESVDRFREPSRYQ
ncbi:RNA recognition motif family protein [Theileria parva strain Muguga]|uniref:RNA recognition motif family protein n=1 Tax=Theileria parva strain Muguga TaxID=333668 RepID=UPI001C61A527|nr:RNA recognition motif family protein [Theileria parva strain Muguga]KAF5153414.1 RNA recognition motif family protein [Theileria parva strain Muguga]